MNKGKNIAWILVLTLLLGGCTITQNTTEQDTQSVQDTSQTEILTEQVQTETVEEMQQTETQEPEPQIQTVTLTATGDCTLGATQTHGYAGSFHEYHDKYGQDYFISAANFVFL